MLNIFAINWINIFCFLQIYANNISVLCTFFTADGIFFMEYIESVLLLFLCRSIRNKMHIFNCINWKRWAKLNFLYLNNKHVLSYRSLNDISIVIIRHSRRIWWVLKLTNEYTNSRAPAQRYFNFLMTFQFSFKQILFKTQL